MFTTPKVAKIVAECEALIATKDDAWSISHEAGMFLHQLALLRRAKVILEIGTSYGHSGLFLADAAARNHGKFVTVEQNPKKVLIAKQYFTQAGLDHVATVLPGTAPDILTLAPNQIDFLFIDATKAQQDAYFDTLMPKLADRAVIVTDNATTHASEMGAFLERLRTDRRFSSMLIPIDHGMELTVRL